MSEKKKIIDLLAQGKITAQQAEELLKAISSTHKSTTTSKRNYFVVELIEQDTNKNIIHLRMPIALIKAGLKFIPKHAQIQAEIKGSSFDISSINWEDIFAHASDGEIGDVLYLEINREGEEPLIIHVYIE